MRARFFWSLAALCAPQLIWLASARAAQFPETLDASFRYGRFVTPAPAYPFLVYGDTHHGTARVVFNERGDATEAALIRSTGDTRLDILITHWIHTHWKSLGGKPATLVTSVK